MARRKRKKNKGRGKVAAVPAKPVLQVTPPPEEVSAGIFEEAEQIPDRRTELLTWCVETAERGIAAMACPRRTEPERKTRSSLLFDLLNSEVSSFDGSGETFPTPLYISTSGKALRCSRQGLYREALVSCYEAFCEDNRSETEYLRQSILKDSIRDCSEGEDVHPGFGLMCLLPDTADAFDQSLRSQLECRGAPLFQLPRSIALAYTLRVQGQEVPPEFLCVDYDGEEVHAIRICETEETAENGERLFVRMGRERISSEHLSYRKLALEYLRLYQAKYQQALTPEAVSSLVDTKLLQRLIRNPEERILINSGSDVVSIRPDSEILEQLRRQTVLDLEEISADKKMPAYGLCSFFPVDGDPFFRLEQLEQGCLEIRRRGEARKILWQEYLPHLELEVNRNGVFDSIELIGEEYRRQNISTFLLEEEVEIPVSNGTVVFPVNGETQYDLPLSREVYGRHSREKLAQFHLQEPLKRDTEVELTVYYCYGNIDSYKLIARSPELDAPLESVWCDQTKELKNLAPSFQARTYEFENEEIKEVYRAFRDFSENVTGLNRPPKTYYGAVYDKPKDSGWYYSKYLFKLNGQGGQPYFPIQNFFRKEIFPESKPYISELLKRGVFEQVARVLRGKLPRGHDLGIDTHNGQDEGRILVRNMAGIACNFGCFFALRNTDPSKTLVHDTIEAILEYYRKQKRQRLQDWTPISKYISRDRDSHGIWDSFSEALQELDPQDPASTMYILRSISGVCYQTENWIFEFYHGPNGPREVDWILKNILAVLYSEECISPKGREKTYNPRKIRDVLELLLCICRLKKEDSSILDCNTPEVRKLVKRLKEIDRRMRELGERDLLKRPFNSRLGIESPEAYYRVNPVIYALIQTLTGGKPVNLIGFTPDQ